MNKVSVGSTDGFTFVTSTLQLGPTSTSSVLPGNEAFVTQKSILQKPGPAAGIFLSAGLVAALLAFCACVLIRRRRRIERRRYLRHSIGLPHRTEEEYRDDAFESLRSPPIMRQAATNRDNIAWGTKRNSAASSEDNAKMSQASEPLIDVSLPPAGFAGVGAGLATMRLRDGDYRSPFSDHNAVDFLSPARDEAARGPSRASIPSVYPSSFHDEDDDDVDSLYEKEIGSSAAASPVANTHFSVPLPISPPPALQPKSPLRALHHRKLSSETWQPPSPPESISRGSPPTPVSPLKESLFDVVTGSSHRYPTLTRQTLLKPTKRPLIDV